MTEATLNPEHLLVGIVLNYASVLDDLEIDGADFADPRCEAVWGAARQLRGKGHPTDPATVAQALRGTPGVDPSWLAACYGAAPSRALANHYARAVADSAVRRRLRMAATRITQMAESLEDAQEAVENARDEIEACTRTITDTGYIADTIGSTIDALAEAPNYTPTPWADLNQLIAGWRPGCLYVIGARPGSGKTILGVQAAVELARHGHVALSSLEMSRQEIHQRILAQVAGVDLGRLINRRLNDADWARIAERAPEIADLPLSIDDRSSARPIDVRSHARSVARKGHLKAIVVDYVQLMSAPAGDRRSRQEVVAQFSRELKSLARGLNVPVLALAQLNRGPATRADSTPVMSDLKESGALEQDADVVLLLDSPEKDPSLLNLVVAKNRHGATASIRLARRGHLARLDNYGWEPRVA